MGKWIGRNMEGNLRTSKNQLFMTIPHISTFIWKYYQYKKHIKSIIAYVNSDQGLWIY